MRREKRILIFVFATLLCSTPAWAQFGGRGGGKQVTLSRMGVTVTVPYEWDATVDQGVDVLVRNGSPPIEILVSIVNNSKPCSELTRSALGPNDITVDNPAFLPPAWHSRVLVTPEANGGFMVTVCGDLTSGRTLIGVIVYGGTTETIDADLAYTTPVLEAVYNTLRGAGGGAVAATPAPATGRRLTLTVARLTADLAADGNEWEASVAEMDGGKMDRIRRLSPAYPGISMILIGGDGGSGACTKLIEGYATSENQTLRRNPRYLPPSWHPAAAETVKGQESYHFVCMQTSQLSLIAFITVSGTLGPADETALANLLDALARAGGGGGGASTGGGGGAYSGSSSGYSSSSTSGGYRSYPRPQGFDSAQWELTVHQLSPGGEGMDSSLGGTLVVSRAAALFTGSSFGAAAEMLLGGGYDLQSELVLDGKLGLGFGVRFGELTLMPLLGIGFDAVGAGADEDPTRFKLPFQFYWYYSAIARYALSPKMAVEAGVAKIGGTSSDETRFDGRLILLRKKKLSLNLHYTRYADLGDATVIGAGVGFGF